MRLHFRELGTGRPVIILHGLFGSLENWAFISGQLSADYRVISVDQRNHGQSPHDPEINYALLAGDIAGFMAEHQLGGACLMGHSMGGKAAMQCALTHPADVGALIVVDMAPRAYERRHDGIFAALLALPLDQFQNRGQVEEALVAKVPEMAMRRFLLKGLGRNAAGGLEWKFNLQALHRSYDVLSGELPARGTYGGPALFIRGAKSNYISDADEVEIRGRFPKARVVTIADASHWVHAEAPENFLRETKNFLRENF
jgi:esterase